MIKDLHWILIDVLVVVGPQKERRDGSAGFRNLVLTAHQLLPKCAVLR